MSLILNEETHIYTFDGREIPSVTQLIPKEDFHVSQEVLEATREEGEIQHRIQEDLLNGESYDTSPFAIGLDEFLSQYKATLGEVLLNEQVLYSKRHRFAGKPDTLFTGGLADRKRSRGPTKKRALQFAGYWILCEENGYITPAMRKAWWEIVWDGEKHVPRNVYSPSAVPVFLALVQTYWNKKILEAYLRAA